ncbi:MAG TPA: PQQ-binding-like beta-propeller repeat protein, partial [Ktedonobacteraceae bacterium]|nr:PQQ-binding-like beta-propeller repeat protein [Ktedonobacteraceae bacterium]
GTQADVVNNVVYIGSYDRQVYALNATRGSVLWHFQTRGRVLSMPTLNNGVVYVGSDDRNLYALNTTDGTATWHFSANGGIEDAPAVVQLS